MALLKELGIAPVAAQPARPSAEESDNEPSDEETETADAA
jgi:hypothetical protein